MTLTLVEIVADGGHAVGFGHVGRCLAIAEALAGEAAFTVSDPDAAAFVRQRGGRLAGDDRAPVVLLDRRAPTPAAEVRTLQGQGRRVALLDDAGEARALADLVIDPPTAAAWPPTPAWRLAGFEHVLLRADVRDARAGAVGGDRVLLGMGGSDPAGLTPPLAAGLAAAGLPLDVARGPGYRGADPAHGRLLPSPAAWPTALARAALVVCGFGHSLLEAAYLGVPAIAVVFLPEHREHARAFAAHGTATTLDMTAGPRPEALAALAAVLLADPAQREAMAARGRALIDGRGAERIAAGLRALAPVAEAA